MRQLTYRIVGKLVAMHVHRIKIVLMCMDVLVYVAIKVSLSDSCARFCILVSVTAVTIINGHLSAVIAITLLAIYSNSRSHLMHSSHFTECVKRYFQYRNDKRKRRRREKSIREIKSEGGQEIERKKAREKEREIRKKKG